MPAVLLPDERLVLDAFSDQLGAIEHWYDGTFGLRPVGDQRRIRLETAFIDEVARLRPSARNRVVAAVVAAFATCAQSVRAGLAGARTLRGTQLADVDLLELRVDEGPRAPAGGIRAA